MEPHHLVDPETIDWRKLKNALKTGGHTRLYAFRAHLRGRMHFAPGTNLALAHWLDRVPCNTNTIDPKLPGGWVYKPITREVVEEWVKDLYKTFAKTAAEPPVRAAG